MPAVISLRDLSKSCAFCPMGTWPHVDACSNGCDRHSMRSIRSGSVEHRLRLGNDAQALSLLTAAIDAFARAAGLSAASRGDLELVLEELVTNVVTHGYGPDRQGCVHVAMRQSGAAVDVTICDRAPAFDPLARPAASNPATLENAPIGGVGVALVRRLTTHRRYRRVAGRNMLVLRLRPGSAESV